MSSKERRLKSDTRRFEHGRDFKVACILGKVDFVEYVSNMDW